MSSEPTKSEALQKGRGAERELLAAVSFARPTAVLSVLALSAWALAVGAGILGWCSAPLAVALATVCAFASFTPMHDAAHHAVAGKSRLNEWIGRLSALPLLVSFHGFRYLHLEHHKHTNEPDADPDHWSGRGPVWLLPLRWLTQDFHYYVCYIAVARQRPRAEAVETLGTVVGVYGLLGLLIAIGFGHQALLFVFLPTRIAIMLLAFAFDYLPHVPHLVTGKQDRYRATAIYDHAFLTPLVLSQNYHLIHHLYPAVPFYRYGKVWTAQRERLIAKGALVRRLWSRAQERPSSLSISIN